MKITIIDGDVAYPATSGKRLRTLNLMTRLSRRHAITYIARSDTEQTKLASEFLSDHGIKPILVPAPLPRKSGFDFYTRLAANAFASHPYSVQSHVHAAVRAAVQHHAKTAATDLWQLEWSGYRYCLDRTERPIVLQAHNVDATLWRRHYEVEAMWAKRLYIKEQWRKFEAFERSVFNSVDRVIAVSEDDRREAFRLYGAHLPIDVVANGVDVDAFATVEPAFGSRTILFLGALDWRPNLDALEFLLGSIMDLVRAQAPDCRLRIVGRHASEHLRQRLAALDWVDLYADVPDVRPHLAHCAVMAVPLRIGGGTRLKILEGLAAGLPMVSTQVGAEGIDIIDGTHLDLADDPVTFAARLSAHVRQNSKDTTDAMRARKDRRELAALYDWSLLADRLEKVWLDVGQVRTVQPKQLEVLT
jgi:polysaccharide biosynthesis protein PslH